MRISEGNRRVTMDSTAVESTTLADSNSTCSERNQSVFIIPLFSSLFTVVEYWYYLL